GSLRGRSPLPHTATSELSTLSLHDALPISSADWSLVRKKSIPQGVLFFVWSAGRLVGIRLHFALLRKKNRRTVSVRRLACSYMRSEEHTSELQSRFDLVCRLLLEKKRRG